MYNLDGIYYYMEVQFLASLIVGILGIVFSLFSKWPKKEIRFSVVLGLLLIVLSVDRFVFYRRVLAEPKIEFFEGQYKKEYRSNDCVWAMDYEFNEDDGTPRWVLLDNQTKKKIFPDEFEKGAKYKIYYEEETRIIVRVERLR